MSKFCAVRRSGTQASGPYPRSGSYDQGVNWTTGTQIPRWVVKFLRRTGLFNLWSAASNSSDLGGMRVAARGQSSRKVNYEKLR
jgi:hypothetical protein